jgi:hypothetical protein
VTLEYLNQILTWSSRDGFVGAVYEADLSGKANNVTDLLIVALTCMPTCYASILNLSSRVGNVISTVLSPPSIISPVTNDNCLGDSVLHRPRICIFLTLIMLITSPLSS